MSAGLTGSVWDDGLDSNGGFTQNSAFTCNIVSAKVMQCVKGNAYASGVPSLGRWLTGQTYIEYGDPVIGTGRIATLMGSVGGQSLPFTAGSGYTNGSYTLPGVCTVGTSGTQPKLDVTVAGGVNRQRLSIIGLERFGAWRSRAVAPSLNPLSAPSPLPARSPRLPSGHPTERRASRLTTPTPT